MTTVEANKKKSNQRIWIGLGIAALFCLCALGVAAFVVVRAGQKVQEGFKTDPAAAAEAAHAIADYELPAGYQEQMAMDLFVYSMVVIDSDSPGKPMIMLAQFQAGADQEQMEQQIRQSFEQQSGRRGMTMTVVEVKEMTIRGAEAEVTIYEGTDENGTTLRQLVTTFPGKGGTAMLMIMGSPEYWDQDEIDTFIESME
jgi:hypothetical protein